MQYYLNCNTCSKTVEYLRQSPNDEILIDVIISATIGPCKETLGSELCEKLATQWKKFIIDGFFDLFITQDYICSYLMPLCGEVLAYEKLTLEKYMEAILSHKPESSIQDASFSY